MTAKHPEQPLCPATSRAAFRFGRGETVFTKAQVVSLYGVTDRTIERYLASHADELKSNGYQVLKGKKLKEFKALLSGTDINDGTKSISM